MIDDSYGDHTWNDSARFQRALEVQISLNRTYRERIEALERRIQRLENLELITRQLLLLIESD